MSGTAIVSIACDAIEWGELQALPSGGCCQHATVYVDGKPVCCVGVVWATTPPAVLVACAFTPRQAGPND